MPNPTARIVTSDMSALDYLKIGVDIWTDTNQALLGNLIHKGRWTRLNK